MKERESLNQSQINDLLRKCAHEDQKAFTQTLKQMEKEAGGSYFVMREEGVDLFHKCVDIYYRHENNSIIQCNALRLAKYALENEKNLVKIYKEFWEIYENTLIHHDGRVRIAGLRMLDRYRFGFSCLQYPKEYILNKEAKKRKAKKEEAEKVIDYTIKKFIELQDREAKYIKKHESNLKTTDIPNENGKPWASETKDKYLKAIRMGLEIFLRGTAFEELLKEKGYKPVKLVTNKIYPPIRLKYHENREDPGFEGIECCFCKKESNKIGGAMDAYTDHPKYFCEDCAITNYQKECGFGSYEAAKSRRRRMFDVSYLFHEIFTDEYMKQFGKKDIDDLSRDERMDIFDASNDFYNYLYDKMDKMSLEETESQKEIEAEFKEVIRDVDMKRVFKYKL